MSHITHSLLIHSNMGAVSWMIVLLTIVLIADEVAGQRGAGILKDKVYTFPYFTTSYDNATNTCLENHGGEMAALDDATSQQFVFNKTNEQTLWVVDYGEGSEAGNMCPSRGLPGGQITLKPCSANLQYTCEATAWYNVTTNMEHVYGFSGVKLRYTDARTICKDQGKKYGVTSGNLVTITSATEQEFIQKMIVHIRDDQDTGEESQYFINSDNKNVTLTKGYSNWETSQVSDPEKCVEISDTTEVGKWKEVSCNDYRHFICKWALHQPTTANTTATMKATASQTHGGSTTRPMTTRQPEIITARDKDTMTTSTEKRELEQTIKGSGSTVLHSATWLLLVANLAAVIFWQIF